MMFSHLLINFIIFMSMLIELKIRKVDPVSQIVSNNNLICHNFLNHWLYVHSFKLVCI